MSAPLKATPTTYTVALDVEGAPTHPMRYSRVPGRRFQPFHVVLTYSLPATGAASRISASIFGWICRKDGSVSDQRTDQALSEGDFPSWLISLADEYRPAGVA